MNTLTTRLLTDRYTVEQIKSRFNITSSSPFLVVTEQNGMIVAVYEPVRRA